MGCPELTYQPTLKVLARTEKSGCLREDKNRTDAYLYKYNGKEWQDELGLSWYDYGWRNYMPDIGRWGNMDPLAENSLPLSPYHFVANNPLIFIDPDGMDWFYYRQEGQEDATWNWHDGNKYEHTYTYTDDDGNEQTNTLTLQGVQAVVVFDGTDGESLGEDGTLTGKGANPAKVTVYGPGGANDIKTYRGLTTSSNPDKYSMIESGDYEGFWQQMATSPFGKGSLTYRIRQLDGNLNLPIAGGEKNKSTGKDYMSQIFLHRTNWSGKASGNVSEGCLIIDARQWREVEGQLGKINSFLIQVIRPPSANDKK